MRKFVFALAAILALSSNAIAEDVGYESAATFSRVFKRWVGESPGNYRHGHRAESEEAGTAATAEGPPEPP